MEMTPELMSLHKTVINTLEQAEQFLMNLNTTMMVIVLTLPCKNA